MLVKGSVSLHYYTLLQGSLRSKLIKSLIFGIWIDVHSKKQSHQTSKETLTKIENSLKKIHFLVTIQNYYRVS